MAITRKLVEISITFDAAGNPAVRSTAIINDSVEDTNSGWNKNWNAQAVLAEAAVMRDAVLAQAAGQGKPLTF